VTGQDPSYLLGPRAACNQVQCLTADSGRLYCTAIQS